MVMLVKEIRIEVTLYNNIWAERAALVVSKIISNLILSRPSKIKLSNLKVNAPTVSGIFESLETTF